MRRLHPGDLIILFVCTVFLLALIFGFFYQEKRHETYPSIAISR